MSWLPPERVLITGRRAVGGVNSFAEGLHAGFAQLGISSEVITPGQILQRCHELRSDCILKILSTTAISFAPLAKRALCVAHGVPMLREHGWARMAVILANYKLVGISPSAYLVAVSDYSASHLKFIFDINVDATIPNPVSELFLETASPDEFERGYITFVGRLVEFKQVDLILPPLCDLLAENPDLRLCIIGDGPYRDAWEKSVADVDRIEFVGVRDLRFIREQLRRSKLFISGATNEAFGIVYLEALSQGCIVAMPAGGGGMEIALHAVGQNIALLPISLQRHEVLTVLRDALKRKPPAFAVDPFSPRSIATAYLEADRLFFSRAPDAVPRYSLTPHVNEPNSRKAK